MEVDAILDRARSMVGAERVFGEPVERDGAVIIPAARVFGGGGGGADESPDGGGGGGFGVKARPAGALIIEDDGSVRWKVPFDLNRVILGGQVLGVAYFFFAWLTARSQARASAKAVIATAALARRSG